MDVFTAISLCTGYDGIGLGIRRVVPNLRTVLYVERETFPICNLVAKIKAGLLDDAPIWSDLKTFDGRPFKGVVDIIHSGFPCQPFSVAGKRRGGIDERHLWPHIERIIGAVEPVWVFLENVPGLLSARSLDNRPDLCQYLAELAALSEVAPTARRRWYLSEHIRRLTGHWLETEGIPAYTGVYFGKDERPDSGGIDLQTAVLWPTPRDSDANQYSQSRIDRAKSGEIDWGKCQLREMVSTDGPPRPDSPSTSGKSQGLWSTPRAEERSQHKSRDNGQALSRQIWQAVKTPGGGDKSRSGKRKGELLLGGQVKGRLNPSWVESLMNLPTGWTNPLCESIDCACWGMPRFPPRLNSPTGH